MSIKTTFNIKLSQAARISQISTQIGYSKSKIINLLFRKVFKSNTFKIRFLQSIQYQKQIVDNNRWKHFHVSLEGVVYEKCLDMRKVFKLSGSLIISDAIDKLLDELIDDINKGNAGDNYSSNYLIFYTKAEYFTQITLVWGMLEQKKLNQLYKIHTHT